MASDEDIIEGLPIPIGGQVPIAFTCRSPQGVGKAFLRYRVNDRGPWVPLPLKVVDADPKWGPFDPNRGTFAMAEYGQQVEFHPVPSPDRDTLPDYLTGGGRFDFQTAELTKVTEDGKLAKLEVGDRVEFYVEVYDRNPAPNRPPGRSESRLKEILTPAEVCAASTRPGRPRARSGTWRRSSGTCSGGNLSRWWHWPRATTLTDLLALPASAEGGRNGGAFDRGLAMDGVTPRHCDCIRLTR